MNIPCCLQLCVIIATIVTLSRAYDGELPSDSAMLRGMFSGYEKRAITRFDRMGRYYGKRSSPDRGGADDRNGRLTYTVDEVQYMVSNSPLLVEMMVRGYLDQNGDGLIDDSELADLKSRVVVDL